MSYDVIEVRYGDVLASYGSLEKAQRELAEFLQDNAAGRYELGLATVDDDGNAVSVQLAAQLPVRR